MQFSIMNSAEIETFILILKEGFINTFGIVTRQWAYDGFIRMIQIQFKSKKKI